MRRLEELPAHLEWFALAIRDYSGEWPTIRDAAFEVRWEFDVPPWDAADVMREALRDETVNMRTGIRYGQERVMVNAVPLCRCA